MPVTLILVGQRTWYFIKNNNNIDNIIYYLKTDTSDAIYVSYIKLLGRNLKVKMS